MVEVNYQRAKLQCEEMFDALSSLELKYTFTDLHGSDLNHETFDLLHDAIEAFRKLRNGL